MSANGSNTQANLETTALRAIARVSLDIAAEPDPRRALWSLMTAIRKHLPLDRIGIFSLDPHTQVISRVVGISCQGEPEYDGESFSLTGTHGPLARVLRREFTHYFSDDAPADFPDIQFQPGVEALGVFPILAGGELLGALATDNCITRRLIPGAVQEPLMLATRVAALPLFALHQRRERERADAAQWNTLRGVFQAVTQGRVQLCDEHEIAREWPRGVSQMPVRSVNDIPVMRARVRRSGFQVGMSEERARDLELCVSEAATNALLHGEGGEVCIGHQGERLRVRIRDWGSGISLDNLPGAALQPGWSTRRSMGLGFTVIAQTADRVLLHTGPQGTTVIIEMSATPELNLPDACNPLLWGDALTL